MFACKQQNIFIDFGQTQVIFGTENDVSCAIGQEIVDGVLQINFKYPSSNGKGDACQPSTRFLVIKMDKVSYKSLEIVGDIRRLF